VTAGGNGSMRSLPARAGLAAGLALLLLAAGAGAAHAHGRSLSYSSWRMLPDGAWVSVRIPLIELTRLGLDPIRDPEATTSIGQVLVEHVRLDRAGRPCEPIADPLPSAAPAGWAVYTWRVRCGREGPYTITSTLLLDQVSSHLHFARVEEPDGSVLERVLTEAAPSWPLGGAASGPAHPTGTTLVGYIALGIEHIGTGWDHISFVLALLLLAGSLGEVASLVTGFTVAHSVTLALATLGVVRPDPPAVEALIGCSIALVAAENGWLLGGRGRAVPWTVTGGLLACAVLAAFGIGNVPALALAGLALFAGCHFGLLDRVDRPARLRAAVAFAFGLVHGFGFAGVLAQMDLPRERLAAALFGFNAGVEIGQLAVVLAFWPVLRLVARLGGERALRPVAEIGSAAICGLGLFWFVTRTFG
jgi:hypothetical protein